MKSSQGGAPLESNFQKGFCDRHVPPDWRRENDVENAIINAQEFYASTLDDWNDGHIHDPTDAADPYYEGSDSLQQLAQGESSSISLTNGAAQGSPLTPSAGHRRKKSGLSQGKSMWKLPSGAPVIPQIVFNTVCDSLVRFGVRKRKEYVVEVCKYWTLKREARRGAGLIRRLQLTETSHELTRRNWKLLGQGRKKLLRRLELAAELKSDVEKLKTLSEDTRRREIEKGTEAEMLRNFVEMVYFPEVPLMWPILEKAQL